MSKSASDQINQMIEAQKQPMEYLVFSGGGAKGAGYSGVHAALADRGILPGVKAVAGSSAGSIAAAAIATGISKEDYLKLTQNTNMKALLGEEGFLINKDGKPLHSLIASTVQNNVSKYLNSIDIKQAVEVRLTQVQQEMEVLAKASNEMPPQEFQAKNAELQKQVLRLEHLRDTNAEELVKLKEKSDTTGKITFKDLDLLCLLNPDQFKALVITATRKDNGELIIFNAEHSPDVEIADACRASSSIPIVFKPFAINGVEYVDGGYRDNIPLRYFGGEEVKRDPGLDIEDISKDPDKINEAKKQGRTMAFAFGSGMEDSANIAIYSAKEKIADYGKLMEFLMDVVFKVLSKVGGKFKYSEEYNELHERLRENALGTVVLDTGEVGTLSFDKAEEKADYLHTKAYIQTMEYVNNHELGNIIDQNLQYKSFILEVYEASSVQSTTQSWANKAIGGHDNKMQNLLNLCKDTAWEGNQSPEQILSSLIVMAATRRSDGELSVDTNTLEKLVTKLNSPSTPNKIKEGFLNVLKIDRLSDQRFDQDKTLPANLASFKFTQNDFTAFLDKHKTTAKEENKDREKTYSEKYKAQSHQKTTEIYQKKEGPKADLISNEAASRQSTRSKE